MPGTGDQVGSLVVHGTAVADLHHQGVDVQNRVKSIDGTSLPRGDLLGDHPGDPRDQRR
jgi:hypothetical protein